MTTNLSKRTNSFTTNGATQAKKAYVDWDDEFKSELLDTITTIQRCKEFKFAVGGVNKRLPSLPGISILNYGMVNLPVTETTVNDLKQHFSQAPYGLGEETLIDRDVRDSWQLDPEKFEIRNQTFKDEVEKLVKDAQRQLDCSEQIVTSHLYKLLLYETGGHFKPHRDTEKFPGMFATLIIQLPSVFTGGDFVVKHGQSESKFSFGASESQYHCMYAAHYADCEHELTEITSGYRLSLVYSLCWDGNGMAPSLPPSDVPTNKLVELLGQLDEELPEPHMFGWALDHQYSENSFLGMGVQSLKSTDYHIYSILEAANSTLEDDKKVDFLIIEAEKLENLNGECTKQYYGRRRYGNYQDSHCDENCFVNCGDNDVEYEMKGITVDGEEMDFDLLEVEELTDIILNELIIDHDDDEEFWGECHEGKCSGPSGNEGASKTNWYRRYVLLIIPEGRF